ncbi:retrotransposable element Tf2 [Tanacetum coccineum]
MCSESKNDNLNYEIEKVKSESIDIQENLLKWIKISENDFQRCQAQSIDFELQLQHQKEKINCEESLKNLCETSWISKTGKLENENVTTNIMCALLYWKKIRKHIKQFVNECLVCQLNKADLAASPILLQPLPIPQRVWSEISMDFIDGLPASKEKTVILE